MRDPELLGEIIRAMVKAVDVPITLKIRSGWDGNENASEVARAAEDAGASAIAVHARSRAEKFTGQADWDVIRRVREAVGIPVIGNGDVRDPLAARDMVSKTGCDMVMIGRWAIGNPWIFQQVESFLGDGTNVPDPTVRERVQMAIRHLRMSIATKGGRKGIYEVRRSLSAYIKGVPGAREMRTRIMTEEDPERIGKLLMSLVPVNEMIEEEA